MLFIHSLTAIHLLCIVFWEDLTLNPILFYCVSHQVSSIKFIFLLALFLPLKSTRALILFICTRMPVLQFCESPLRAYTLFPRQSPPCLVTAHVPVTSTPCCRGGKRLDSREFREKNFLIRVHKTYINVSHRAARRSDDVKMFFMRKAFRSRNVERNVSALWNQEKR